MSLQLLGFGLAGMMRRFLVKPAAMYWPSTLSTVAMFVGFHENEWQNEPFSKYRMSRYKFFLYQCGEIDNVVHLQWVTDNRKRD